MLLAGTEAGSVETSEGAIMDLGSVGNTSGLCDVPDVEGGRQMCLFISKIVPRLPFRYVRVRRKTDGGNGDLFD